MLAAIFPEIDTVEDVEPRIATVVFEELDCSNRFSRVIAFNCKRCDERRKIDRFKKCLRVSKRGLVIISLSIESFMSIEYIPNIIKYQTISRSS